MKKTTTTNESTGQRSTAAGRLLQELTADGAITLRALAMVLEVPERHLAECRDGNGRLDPKVQLKLANLAPVMSSRLRPAARRLHEQARAALQYESEGAAIRHTSYPREQFR
jgi:ParB-like chromosome segregation protein Spo0J